MSTPTERDELIQQYLEAMSHRELAWSLTEADRELAEAQRLQKQQYEDDKERIETLRQKLSEVERELAAAQRDAQTAYDRGYRDANREWQRGETDRGSYE